MYTIIVGLNVVNEEEYKLYREGMTPMVHAVNGYFRYDFKILETLKTEATHPINRLFLLSFPSKTVSEQFFADPKYLEVRRAHFDKAVKGRTQLAQIGE
ncbi:DUF1330 domain-containing protein [bacterium]|nr:DUF1330 domain-containing protein [bacterium]